MGTAPSERWRVGWGLPSLKAVCFAVWEGMCWDSSKYLMFGYHIILLTVYKMRQFCDPH